MFQEPDPTTALGRLNLRARRVPAPLRAVLVLIPFALTGYCMYAYAGPYAFFANMQAGASRGTYSITLTAALTLLLFLVPTGVVIHLLATLFPDRSAPAQPPAQWPPAHMQQQWQQSQWPPQQGQQHQQGPWPPQQQGQQAPWPPQQQQAQPPPQPSQQGPWPPQQGS